MHSPQWFLTFLHSVYPVSAYLVAVLILAQLARNLRLKYLCLTIGMLAALLFPWLLPLTPSVWSEPIRPPIVLDGGVVVGEETMASGLPALSQVPQPRFDIVGVLYYLWLAGFSFLTFRLLGWYICLCFCLRRNIKEPDGAIKECFEHLLAGLQMEKKVRLLVTSECISPMSVGIWSPAVILPLSLVRKMSAGELTLIFRHELVHIRRYDNLRILAQRLAEASYFFHPLVWLASRSMERWREISCDDEVLGSREDGTLYAQTIFRSLELQTKGLFCAPFFGTRFQDTKLRLQKILIKEKKMTSHHWNTILSLSLAFLLFTGCLFYWGTSNGLLWGQEKDTGVVTTNFENQKILTKLENTKVEWYFEETPFADFVAYCRTSLEINIVMDPKELVKLEKSGTKVNLRLKDLKCKDALQISLDIFNLGYVVKGGVLLITNKEHALEIAKSTAEKTVAAETEAARETLRKMQSEVSLDFAEAPLPEVIEFIRNQCQINIIIAPAVFQNFTDKELLVDISVNNLSLQALLNIMLEMKGLSYHVEGGGVVVIDVPLIVKKYPIQNLIERSGMRAQYLLNLLQKECERGGGMAKKASLSIEKGELIVKQHPTVVAKVEEILGKFMAGLETTRTESDK